MADKGKAEKSCFVIAPIGEEGSDTRRRSDQVLKHIIRPAAEACGYEATRADEIDKPGLITSQVIQRVVGDQLVIADLTGINPNVFYELAIRHAIRRPLVQLIEKGERIPFDVAGTRTVYVDHQDLDSAASARTEIISQIRSLEASPQEIETPISVSLDLQNLRQSEKPEDRSFAEVISGLSDIRSHLTKIIETRDTEYDEKLTFIINRIEKYLIRDSDNLMASRRYGRISQAHIRDIIQSATSMIDGKTERALKIAIVSSLFRESAPWIFETGMEVYRQSLFGNERRLMETMNSFQLLVDSSIQSPALRDLVGRDDQAFWAIDLLRQVVRP